MQRVVYVVKTLSGNEFLSGRRNHDSAWRSFDKARLFSRLEDATQAVNAIHRWEMRQCQVLGVVVSAPVEV